VGYFYYSWHVSYELITIHLVGISVSVLREILHRGDQKEKPSLQVQRRFWDSKLVAIFMRIFLQLAKIKIRDSRERFVL
jgi:hypothetical protein